MGRQDRPDWLTTSSYKDYFSPDTLAVIRDLKPSVVKKGTLLFRPGDQPKGFVLVLSGRVGVYLIGAAGREMLLYAVEPGETCVQTTLGLMADQNYAAEAVAETDCSIVLIPQKQFVELMNNSGQFRAFVFKSFGDRLADVTHMLEQVAFTAVETRLARQLVELKNEDAMVAATHQELATRIGTSREVVSRRLEALKRDGILVLERGAIRIVDPAHLARIAHQNP